MNVNDTCRQIMNIASMDELRVVSRMLMHAVNTRQDELARRATFAFRPGTRVQFTAKGGQVITGLVQKVNQKTVQVVSETGMPWKVSSTLLRAA